MRQKQVVLPGGWGMLLCRWAKMRSELFCGCAPPAVATYLGSVGLAREVLFVDLAAGLAPGGIGVWAAAVGRARAGRGPDEPPPSKASDTSMAPFTSPKAAPGIGVRSNLDRFGIRAVLCLVQQAGQVEVSRSTQRRQHEGIDCILQHGVIPFGRSLRELSDRDRSRGRRTRHLGRPGRKPRAAGRGRLRGQRFGSGRSGCRRRRNPRHGEGRGTGRALDLAPGPLFITRDVLPALGAGEFDFSHRHSLPGRSPTVKVLSR